MIRLRHQLSSASIVLDKTTVTDHVSAPDKKYREDARIIEAQLSFKGDAGSPHILIYRKHKHCLTNYVGSSLDFWLTRAMDKTTEIRK